MTITEMKTKLEQRKAEAQAKLAEKLEISQLERELQVLENDKLIDIKVKAQLFSNTTDKLTEFIDSCTDIVNSIPVLNKSTKENRKFLPSYRYNLGKHIELLTGLMTGIKYSASQHKPMLLEVTDLTEYIIDEYTEALGTLSYYSPRYNTIVEGQPVDLPRLLETVQLASEALQLNIDTSKLTDKTFNRQEEIAITRAQLAKEEADSVSQLEDQVLAI